MGDEKAPQQEALDPNDPRLASDGGDVKKGLDQEVATCSIRTYGSPPIVLGLVQPGRTHQFQAFRQLGNDGGGFNWLGAPDHGSPVGKHYLEGRTPLFIAYDHDVDNNLVPIGMYVVVAKSPTGVIERFGPQF
jgi:hypothetical protein